MSVAFRLRNPVIRMHKIAFKGKIKPIVYENKSERRKKGKGERIHTYSPKTKYLVFP